jgi:excisionase family DNA binding protein
MSGETLVRALAARKGAFKVREVAELLGLSTTLVYQMVRANRIPHFKIGYSLRFDGRRLAEWLEQKEVLPLSMMPQQEVWRAPTSRKARSKISQ